MHDGAHPDLVNMRNDTRNIIRTPSQNKIRLEDKRNQEHIKISTEYGKSQVSAGHLVDAERKMRGEGLEARTDHWIAVRAAKGLMLTTEPQPKAQGQQLDMTAAVAALESALSLARTLQQCATTAGASAAESEPQEQLKQALDKLQAPGLLAYAEKGQAFATPESLQLSAGADLIATAGSNASVNVLKKFSLAVGDKLSLFARKLGIQMIAGEGNIDAQAQRGEMHFLSQKDFTLMSTDGKVNASAKQGIQLSCGGGGIRINADGSVEIFSPTAIDLKGPNLAFKGPESVKTTVPAFEKGTFKRRFQLHAQDDAEQTLPNQKFRLTSSTGNVIEGVTDAKGQSSLLDSDDIETFKMELIHD
ncbi:type VI secretion system Vgr family protein [Rahnella sp. ChDrAdgB13]|nr:type VI secretion system Vgr family protein [Rahnella sp. ChDrAdgB13]